MQLADMMHAIFPRIYLAIAWYARLSSYSRAKVSRSSPACIAVDLFWKFQLEFEKKVFEHSLKSAERQSQETATRSSSSDLLTTLYELFSENKIEKYF